MRWCHREGEEEDHFVLFGCSTTQQTERHTDDAHPNSPSRTRPPLPNPTGPRRPRLLRPRPSPRVVHPRMPPSRPPGCPPTRPRSPRRLRGRRRGNEHDDVEVEVDFPARSLFPGRGRTLLHDEVDHGVVCELVVAHEGLVLERRGLRARGASQRTDVSATRPGRGPRGRRRGERPARRPTGVTTAMCGVWVTWGETKRRGRSRTLSARRSRTRSVFCPAISATLARSLPNESEGSTRRNMVSFFRLTRRCISGGAAIARWRAQRRSRK